MLALYALFEDAFFVFKAIYLFLVLAGNRVKRMKNGGCIKVDALHIYAKRELKVNKYPKLRL